MSTATERLVDAHLAAYCDHDAGQRAASVRRLWNADGRLVDPPFASVGHAGIAEQGGLLVSQFPGHRFERTTQVDVHHEFVRYGWRLSAPDGAAVLEGVDIMELDVDGRIGRVIGFFGAQPGALA